MKEVARRRAIQEAYNKEHNITPQGIRKAIRDITERVRAAAVSEKHAAYTYEAPASRQDMMRLVKDLEIQMKNAARALEFEKAALIRDRIIELRREMVIENEQQSYPRKARR